jgi:membrane-bound lytic murein transglycosylase A
MLQPLSLLTFLGLILINLPLSLAQAQTLHPLDSQALPAHLSQDSRLWQKNGDKQALLRAVNHSLAYLQTPQARRAYANYSPPEITRARVERSLRRFRVLLEQAQSPQELQVALEREFILYRSIGHDGQGSVHFTGYFEPIYQASRQPNAEYRYPLYRKPTSFSRWSKPHPSRSALEGEDGLLGKNSPLSGYELVWLKDRLEAYLVHVQGSAQLRLPNGKLMGVGFDGSTDYPYTSIGKELIKAGIFTPETITLPLVIDYLRRHPEKLSLYLPRNDRFIFFRETSGTPATGSIGVPVTAERSIATDKSLMPPGALALIFVPIPDTDSLTPRLVSRFVLDQDTGSAIQGLGRVDIFMGTGPQAGDRAGRINHTGQLYYLLLKN